MSVYVVSLFFYAEIECKTKLVILSFGDNLVHSVDLDQKYSTTRRLHFSDMSQFCKDLNCDSSKQEGGLRTKGRYKLSENDIPLITVVTVVFNDVNSIEKTLKSVLKQSYDNVEFIVIDGGSTDGTLDIIKSYDTCIDYWISERDKGVYDAMNKALNLFSGQWINFMNCGDVFVSDEILSSVAKVLSSSSEGIVSGNVRIVDLSGKSTGKKHPYSGTCYRELIKYNCVAHQATFVHTNAVRTIGVFESKYKIHGDYDYWIRAMVLNIKIKYLNIDIANFCNDGISSNRNLVPVAIRERFSILEENGFLKPSSSFVYKNASILYYNIKSFIRYLIKKN